MRPPIGFSSSCLLLCLSLTPCRFIVQVTSAHSPLSALAFIHKLHICCCKVIPSEAPLWSTVLYGLRKLPQAYGLARQNLDNAHVGGRRCDDVTLFYHMNGLQTGDKKANRLP